MPGCMQGFLCVCERQSRVAETKEGSRADNAKTAPRSALIPMIYSSGLTPMIVASSSKCIVKGDGRRKRSWYLRKEIDGKEDVWREEERMVDNLEK